MTERSTSSEPSPHEPHEPPESPRKPESMREADVANGENPDESATRPNDQPTGEPQVRNARGR